MTTVTAFTRGFLTVVHNAAVIGVSPTCIEPFVTMVLFRAGVPQIGRLRSHRDDGNDSGLNDPQRRPDFHLN